MRIGDIGGERAFLVRADGHRFTFGHVDDLARPGGDRSGICRDRKPAFQNDHDVINRHGFGQALARRVTSIADGDRPSVPLVDQIADGDVCLLSGERSNDASATVNLRIFIVFLHCRVQR